MAVYIMTGVVLVSVISNAAEQATAVTVAMKNKMDLSGICSFRIELADCFICRSRTGYNWLDIRIANGSQLQSI